MTLLRFSVFEIDQTSGELTRQGRRVAIASQPFKVLSLLASRAGAVVTREELRRAVWSDGTHVDFERGLNFCIASARAALGDDARRPRFIETIPRQGYRFIAEVRCVDPVTPGALPAPASSAPVIASPRRHRRYRFWAGAAAACLMAAHGDPIVRAHDRDHAAPAALEAFERGLRLPSDPEGLRARLAAFDASRRLDPLFAEAWYAVGETYASMAGLGVMPPRAAMAGAAEAADRALSLEDRPGSRVLRGQLHLQLGWDVTRSRADLSEALRQAPTSDAAWSAYASMLSAAGDDAGAIAAANRVEAISPTCDLQWLESARIHYRARQYDIALAKLAQARLFGPADDGSRHWQTELRRLALLINVQREDWLAARAEASALLELSDATAEQRRTWAALPARRAVMAYLHWAADRLQARALRGELSGTVMARLNALLGRDDDALAWLERAVRDRDPEVVFALRDPAFDRVRQSPRWPALG